MTSDTLSSPENKERNMTENAMQERSTEIAEGQITTAHFKAPSPGELICIAPGIFWLRMPLPFKLDHINLYLLKEEDGWTLIDCGLANDESQTLWQTLEQEYFADLPVKRIIATHAHVDHMSAGGQLCRRWNAPLYITEGELKHLNLQTDTQTLQSSYLAMLTASDIPEKEANSLSQMGSQLGHMFSELTAPVSFMQDGDHLTIGDYSWQVIVAEGHCIAHASLYCQQAGILISGDQVLPGISSNVSVRSDDPEGNPLQHWLNSLQRLKSLPADILILPAHEMPFYGLHERLNQLEKDHHKSLQQLRTALDHQALNGEQNQDYSVLDLVKVLYPRELSPFETVLACGECLAHLHYLRGYGSLEKTTDTSGIWRFKNRIYNQKD